MPASSAAWPSLSESERNAEITSGIVTTTALSPRLGQAVSPAPPSRSATPTPQCNFQRPRGLTVDFCHQVWPGPPRLFFVIRHLPSHACSSSWSMSSKTYYARGSAEDFLRLSLHSSAAASCVFSALSLVRGWRRDQGFDDKWTVKPEKKVEGWTEVRHCTYTCACYGLGDVFGTPCSILSFDSRY